MIEKIITKDTSEAGLKWFMTMVGRGVEAYGKVRVTIDQAKRTNQQNRLMWKMLNVVSKQKDLYIWDGRKAQNVKATPEDWKAVFTAALTHETRVAQGIYGGRVYLSKSTRRMNKEEFSELLELIFAYCGQEGIDVPPATADEYNEWVKQS